MERERSSYSSAGLDRNTLAGLGFSIPIPFRQRNADDMEQARFDRIEAEATSEALRFRVRNEYAEAFRARLDAWRLAKEASGEIGGEERRRLSSRLPSGPDKSAANATGSRTVAGTEERCSRGYRQLPFGQSQIKRSCG